jgi:hypothetical protein
VQRPPDDDEISESGAPDLHRIVILVTEAKAAARTLYELFPNQGVIETLYRYLDEALAEVLRELA